MDACEVPRGGRRALVATAFSIVFLAAGCGGGGGGSGAASDVVRGRQLFQLGPKGSELSCGFCHTLKTAETDGPFGPSLDQEGKEYHRLGWPDSKIRGFVLGWMRKGDCLDEHDPSRCMPRGLVEGDDAEAIAALLTTCAGKPAAGACRPVAGGAPGEAAKGERFFATLGCVSCHWTAGSPPLGPTLDGVAGSQVELASGRTVAADDDYLLSSILHPDKDTVKGFQPGLMSSRIPPGQVSVDQANAIVAYVKTLK